MRLFFRRSSLALLAAAFALGRPAAADPPAYTVTDLGTLPGGSSTNAYAISPNGQVGGSSLLTATGYSDAFIWTPGSRMRDLGQAAAGNSAVRGLNAAGQAAGSTSSGQYYSVYNAYSGTYSNYLAYWGFETPAGGAITSGALVPPVGGRQSACFAVNASGEIVGQTGTSQPYDQYDGPTQGFAQMPGQAATLLPTLGGSFSVAYAVNDGGLIAGGADLPPAAGTTYAGPQHAALWRNGQVTDLGTLGGSFSLAYGLNAAGQVVGNSTTSGGGTDAFVWQNGQMSDLGNLTTGNGYSKAEAINSNGQIVGQGSGTGGYGYRTQAAMLWQGGQVYDLNTLLVGDTGWQLSDATALNDSGQIVGSGTVGGAAAGGGGQNSGASHAFLLTPLAPGTPRVGTLSPSRARVGDGSLPVTVTGAGFTSGAAVQWNGAALATTFVSATQVTATVPAADLSAPTLASVTVVNPSTGPVAGQLNFVVQPVGLLTGFSASPSFVLAGSGGYGWVTLSQPAGPGGYLVSLGSSSSLLTFTAGEGDRSPGGGSAPAITTILVPAGSSTVYFGFQTTPDPAGSAALPITLAAQDGAISLTQTVTLDSLLLSGVTFSPSTVVSGTGSTGAVTLTGPAPAGGFPVFLSSGSSSVTVPASLTIPAGATSATFPVTTSLTASTVTATITASSGSPNYNTATGTLTLTAGDFPTTTASLSGPAGQNGWYTGPVTVTLTATDKSGPSAIAATYYWVNGGALQTYTGPFTLSGDGGYSVAFQSISRAGGVESQKTVVVRIDGTPPVSTIGISSGSQRGDGAYYDPLTVSLAANDVTSGTASFSYTVDGGAAQTAAQTAQLTLGIGAHTLVYHGVDVAGNVEPSHTQTYTVVNGPPTTTVFLTGPGGTNGWYVGPVTVTMMASDPEGPSDIVGTYYDTFLNNVGGVPMQTYTAPFTLSADGRYELTCWSVDKAGNQEPGHGPSFLLDSTPPVTTATVAGGQVTLSATDATSGVAATYDTLDGGAASPYSGPFAAAGHSVSYWSVDVAGNREPPRTLFVTGSAPASVSLTSSVNPSLPGQATLLTVTVRAASGTTVPTGAVVFKDGGTVLVSSPIGGGKATLSTALAIGSHALSVSYSGDAAFAPASGTLTQTVKKTGFTGDAVASSAPAAVFGQSVTFTVTLTPPAPATGTPTGAVTFADFGTALATVPLVNGQATLTTSALILGSHKIIATYAGDTSFGPGYGYVTQTIARAGTATTLTSSAAAGVAAGQSVTFTASVSAVAPGGGTPTGSIVFADGGKTLATVALAGGKASLTTSALKAGSHTLTASYWGDHNFTASSAALSQTVSPAGH